MKGLIKMTKKIKEIYKKDATINNIHFAWGWDLPATDVDCLFVEYKYPNEPKAIIEYKHDNWDKNFSKGPIQALEKLSERAELPFFIVIWTTFPEVLFRIFPMNEFAKLELAEHNIRETPIKAEEVITEVQYVNFMTFIRREQ